MNMRCDIRIFFHASSTPSVLSPIHLPSIIIIIFPLCCRMRDSFPARRIRRERRRQIKSISIPRTFNFIRRFLLLSSSLCRFARILCFTRWNSLLLAASTLWKKETFLTFPIPESSSAVSERENLVKSKWFSSCAAILWLFDWISVTRCFTTTNQHHQQ